MKTFITLVIGFGMLILAHAVSRQSTQTVTLAWDGSPDPTVIGYNAYYGGAPGSYTNKLDSGPVTQINVASLASGGTYYFAVTAYNSAGLESVPSNEISYSVPTGPGAPTALTPTLKTK